jgi:alkylation response protein AidB-like acyl-CoA dehydrogenase
VKSHVSFGASAQAVVVPCREPAGGVALFVVEVPAPGASVEPEVSVDSTRRTARITLDGVRVGKAARLDGDGLAALRATHRLGWTILAAEMVGAAESVLVRTCDYAAERRQFDRAIGSFQAVKHPLVDIMVGVELARSLVLGAAAALDRDPATADVPARMAKAMACDVLALAVRKGVQLHGGYGFTWDCDVHFYFKRALASRGTLGDAMHHRRHLATHVLG